MSEATRPCEPRAPAHARRIAWALKESGTAIGEALKRDASSSATQLKRLKTPDQALHLVEMLLEQADPTSNKRFTPWLAREYAAGRLILEDLGSANETLSLFLRYAPRLQPAERDIQRYGSLAAAWEAVRGFAERAEAHSNRAQKVLDRAKAYAESRILRQDPDGFTVAVPLTEFAAKWWGRGTRWCTAAEKTNQFWEYHCKAPLIVFSLPKHGKFQMWVTGNQFQFMDAADRSISLKLSRTLWPWISLYLFWALKVNGHALRHFPREHQTPENRLAAVRATGHALSCIPLRSRTAELCLAAVQQNGDALQWVPVNSRTSDICWAAIFSKGDNLLWVPREHLTLPLRLASAKRGGRTLDWVPKEHRTPELCLIAVQSWGHALQWVPKDYRSYALCLTAVKQNGNALCYVPEVHKTYEICLTAVKQAGASLRWVPEIHRTGELLLEAVSRNGMTLPMLPIEFRSRELCLAAVCNDAYALHYVPDEHLTLELCRAAVSHDRSALRWIPRPLAKILAVESCPPKQAPKPNWGTELLDQLESVALGSSEPKVAPNV